MGRCWIQITLVYSFTSLAARPIAAQEIAVKDVRFSDLGRTVEIGYTLEGNPELKYNVTVTLSHDGGTTYGEPLRYVSGDVGRNNLPGRNKTIIWELETEYPFGLVGDHFVFAVTAESQKVRLIKLPLVLASATLVGAFITILATRETAEAVMTISVPAEFE